MKIYGFKFICIILKHHLLENRKKQTFWSKRIYSIHQRYELKALLFYLFSHHPLIILTPQYKVLFFFFAKNTKYCSLNRREKTLQIKKKYTNYVYKTLMKRNKQLTTTLYFF